jgi:hypothetical protein
VGLGAVETDEGNDGKSLGAPQAPPLVGICQYVATNERRTSDCVPSKGERIELVRPRMGVRVRGTVFYSDQLQILVKWDDGRSESLRPGVDNYRKVDSRHLGAEGAPVPTST